MGSGTTKKIKEKCEACAGKGTNTTDFIDDESACMNCNGSGEIKYTPFRKIKPATFDTWYNDEDFVLLIKPTQIYGFWTIYIL